MATSYTRFVVRTSLVQASIILFNLMALASFFFIQVGSIFFIVPAMIIDVLYLLNQQPVGNRKDSAVPSFKIMRLVLLIILASLFVFSILFLVEVLRSS